MERAASPHFKILFITQDDPFYVRLFFEEFLAAYDSREEIAGVVLAAPMGKKSPGALARQMLDFYGPLNFLRVGSRYAAYRVGDRIAALTGVGKSFSVGRLCEVYGIPVLRESRVNSPEFLERVAEIAPDLIISVAAPVVFKTELLGTPRRGCINIHHGMLPRYRGMLPNFWQMYHGEKRAGITVHEMSEKLDDGGIIIQEEVEIGPDETLDALIRRTKRLGARVMIRAIGLIKSGEVSYRPNRAEQGSYFTFPSRQDVREFRRRGKRIL
jgi:methionyl-tRNA formyltransferase